MHANEGYCVILDNDYFNGDAGKVWENKGSGSKVYLYFPSATTVGNISATSQTYTVPTHLCTSTRTWGTPTKYHSTTDSHWNMIGVPLLSNHAASSEAGSPGAVLDGTVLHYYYAWSPSDNQFSVGTASSTIFQTMYGYMVQYTGSVTFTGSVPASLAAPRRTQKQNYTIELQVLNSDEEMLNHAYVELREDACDTFALNEDLYLSTNSLAVNVYTFAGNYEAAANVLSINNHIVPVGVVVKTAGTYTFSMPSNFSGTVTLIDNFTNTRTNLAVEDYEVSLEKGTIDDRFELEININNMPTAIDGVSGDGSLKDGKAHKFIMNDQLYILRNGVLYDARGARVK